MKKVEIMNNSETGLSYGNHGRFSFEADKIMRQDWTKTGCYFQAVQSNFCLLNRCKKFVQREVRCRVCTVVYTNKAQPRWNNDLIRGSLLLSGLREEGLCIEGVGFFMVGSFRRGIRRGIGRRRRDSGRRRGYPQQRRSRRHRHRRSSC